MSHHSFNRALFGWLGLVALGFRVESGAVATAAAVPAKVDFNHDIRPILSENCFACHGPDEDKRKARLRLDLRENALQPAKSGAIAIVPGSVEKSELINRVTNQDEDERMPPSKTGKRLTPAQV